MVNKKKNGSLILGIAGTIIGAGVAAATALVMNDKNNRKKVKGVFEGLKNQALSYADKLQSNIDKNKTVKKLRQGKKS